MNRGEVWRYEPVIARPGACTLRLIVGSDAINDNDALAVVLTLHVLDSDPGGLLAVHTPYGWASALHPEATVRRRLTEQIGVLDNDTLGRVSAAVRAAYDL